MRNILDDILRDINQRSYRDNQKLPSESEMSYKYGVSRHEVRKAYEWLSEMGYVEKRPGIGHFIRVIDKKIDLDLTGSAGFTDKMHSQGVDVQTENLGVYPHSRDPLLSSRLEIPPEEPIYRIDRRRTLGEVPVALHISYVSGQRFPSIEVDGLHVKSMQEYYQEKGYRDFSFEEGTLQTMMGGSEERALLNCPVLVPILLYEGVWRVQESGEILEFSKVLYRGDYFTYRL